MSETAHAATPDETAARYSEVVAAIYTAITLLGVISAASWKGLFSAYNEIFVIIIGTTITVAIAHLWAGIAAHRLIYQSRLTPAQRRHEIRNALAIMAVGVIAALVLMQSWIITDSLESAVRYTLGALVLVIITIGVVGSRLRGAGWLKSLGWGLIDASIGIVALLAKVLLGS